METTDDQQLIVALKSVLKHLKKEAFSEGIKRKPLMFGYENSKLKGTYTFSLPAGWSCPGANICFTKANRITGKLSSGPESTLRCFSASQENTYPSLRAIRWHNFDLLKSAGTQARMVKLILSSLPKDAQLIRIHVSGDFFSQTYFDAWLEVAKSKPNIIFYAYTKSIPFWLNRKSELVDNFRLTASLGSKWDKSIIQQELKSARIVFSPEEAKSLDLEIDRDDTHAWKTSQNFALLIHGTQKAGSVASKAWSNQWSELRKKNSLTSSKKRRKVQPPTVSSLTAQVVRAARKLWDIQKSPVYKLID